MAPNPRPAWGDIPPTRGVNNICVHGRRPWPRGRGGLLGLLAVLSLPPACQAWEIRRFSANLQVQPDGQLEVAETLEVEFGQEPHHGIYRDIPVDYLDRFGQALRLRWSLDEVTDERGVVQPTTVSHRGRYERIRIGDSATMVTGPRTYVIRYHVSRAITRFADHDELFWNVTGNEWAVPIASAEAVVALPVRVDAAGVRAAAFTGVFGSRAADVELARLDHGARCATTRPLQPGEGLTIVVGWPIDALPSASSASEDAVAQPSRWQRLVWWLSDNWGYGLPILTWLGMGAWWMARGREFPGGSIAVQYEPPEGLKPAEIGALIDDRVDIRDITATIIDLAVRGYLTIEPVGKTLFGHPSDYRLTRRAPTHHEPAVSGYEQLMLEALFGPLDHERLLSELEHQFYRSLPGIREEIFQALISKGCLDSNPEQVRLHYWVAAGVVAALSLWGVAQLASMSVILGALASAAVIAIVGCFMPRKTRKGREVLDRIRGLEEFLARTDKDRLARMDPETLFERMLPYALALGVATRWAAAFNGLARKQPGWYLGNGGMDFSTNGFLGDLNRVTARMASTLVSSPRTSASSGESGFGSGGFSGGGFGGGGGGAW